MRRLAGCLASLPSRQRSVLVLRAGVGPREPMSRSRVGRRLELRAARVARIERRGVRRLRALGSDGCGGAPAAATVGAAAPPSSSGSPTADPPAAATTEDAAAAPRSGAKAELESSSAADERSDAAAVPSIAQDEGADLSIVVVLLALLLVGYAIARELRSSDPHPG